ncbi:uncharacterized protein LOC128162900 isoform X14 [Crassostrea angulata]|uniref:uncharacterized protein LOC128162900 isoform X14 n=1 Tax=Magallana angulata TaxID=2784310 RepID=UPI0022B08E8E|nr:uncharacterized protein LOC128162900 isoform X14 [Crassostrea angulata]
MAGICLLELLAACILFSTVLSCPNNCNGRGTCDRSVVPNQCRCQPNYIGEGCEFETFEETRMDPFTPLVSLENIDYLPFAVKACGNVYFELRRSDTGGYGFELGGPGIPFSSLDRVPSRETGQLDTHRGPMMDCQNFREFWLDWDTGMVRLGTGSVRGQNVVLNSPSEPIPGISQIIFNSGSWKLPLQYKAPLETNAQMSEFNGVDIQGNTGMMQQGSPMVIGGVNQPLSGQFVQGQTMFAPNQMGSHTHTGTTNLRQSPIEEVNLSSGRSLEIECGIKSADPNLEIKWTKNGVPWTPPPNNPKIYFTNNKRKIVFESVTEEDNGNYMCVANNLFKTSSTTDLFLESPESAMIVHEPTRLSPTLGKRLEILCDIHSTDPNLKISWMKDGRPFNPMEGERISFYFDNKIIVFNAVEEGDKGKYTCRGSDGYVNPTSIIVNVLKPESNKFTDIFGPQSNSAAEQAGQLINTGALQSLPIGSGYFEIVCNANPNDITSAIRWTKNGKPFNLNPQNPNVYFTRDRRKIIFENLSPADNGIYTCYLNDTDVSSASTDLFIENANDAMVSFMPETKHPMVGGILELRCDVTSSDPNVQLSWTKNSEPLLPGRRVIMQNKNSLVTVYNVTAQDSGQYKCIANGDLSTAVSTFVNVHSKEPGTVASEMDNNKFASLFGNTGGGQFFLDGNRMSGNQMVQGSVLGGGQMVQGQMIGGQMVDGSMMTGGQMVGGQMSGVQMVGGQMSGGQMIGGQMVGGQMVGNSVAGMRTISQGPMEEKVISSGYFEINCNIPGTNDGEITWLKDGNVYLIPSNRPVYFKNNKKTIVFLSVAPEDNGLYTCIVNNQYQASASTELFIKNKEYYNEDWAQNAVVVHEPQTLNPVRGTRLELTCDITTTNPNIRLTWLKNDVPVQPTADQRIQFQNYNQLILFDPVVPGDEGKYTCQANDPMRTSVSTFVKVHEREESRTMYATMSLSSGSTIQQSNPMQEINIKSGYFEINCLIDSGNAEIFWAKNGQPFNPPAGRAIYFADNKKKIVFERVKEEDSGLYTCVANNEYLTSVSTDLFIEGNTNTAIVVYVPQRLNPIIGSRLEITCSVHDHDSATNPNMQVTWFKENVPIAAENNPNIIFQQNGRKMILRSVSASDQGNYMCAVNDPNVTPVVMYIQPHANAATRQRHFGRFLGQAAAVASSRIPIEAGNLRIQCDVADDSTSSIAWFKDNRPLDDTLPNVAFEDDFRRLVLLAFGPSDRGVYMCLTGGQNWHSAAQELIYINSDEAGVTTKPMKIYPIFNSAVEIKCRIPGLQPTDAVSWEYEGIPLVAEPEQVVLMDNDQTLWIKSFQPSDVGRYTCKANGYQWSMYLNGYSTPLERSAALGNPMFMESLYWMYGPRRQISFGTPMPYPIIGGRVEIMCGLQISNPNTIIRWLKDGRPLQRMKPTYYMYNGRSLVLFGFSAADNGRYTCVANDGSMSSASTSLSYTTPDSAMATYEPPNVNPLMGRRAEIVCNIQNLPADVTVQWLKDGIPFNIQSARVRFLNNNRKIEFSPVYASDAGSYECVADTEQREAYTTSVKVFRDDNGRVTDVYGDPTFLLSQIDDRSFPNLEIGSPMDLPTQDGVVELYCGVKNPNPNAVFTWMKDGRPITRNPVYYKNDGRVLVIPDFEPADNGRYTCITNDNILSSSSTLLNYVSPALASATYQPPRLNPITGRKVVVKCSIPNLPPGVSVSWIKNGQPFQPPAGRARLVDNNRRIEFSYVYPEDAGSYTCMATDGSTLSHSTGVNVYKNDKDRTNTVYGPAMTITPVTIPEPGTGPYPGQPIAPSDGSVPQGQLPGQPIAPGPYIPEDNIPTGQVPEQPIPPGPYVPEDNLPTGQLPEAPIIPPDFPTPPGTYVPQENVPTGILPERTLPSPDASIPQGQPLSYPIDGGVMYLRCGIQTNDPNFLIRWLKDGRPIRRMNPTYYMYNGRILVLMGVTASDNGRYTCVANDRTMSSSSTNLQYENPGSATATYNPPKLNPVTGDKAEIYCNIPNLDPGYQITWLKDGQLFEPQSQRVQLVANSRKLEFSSVYPEDAGTYTCTANDEMGTSYTTDVNVYPDGTLRESDVYGSPTFLLSQNDKPKEDLTIGSRLELPLDSGTAEMLCGIQTNNPNAIFTWLKDGQPITRTPVFYKDDGRVLVLPNFTPADNGKYTCVTNDKSMSSSSTDIQYVDPGTAVAVYEPPEMNPLTDDKTELFCDISNLQPFDNVRWFKDGNPFEVQNQRIQIVDRNRKIEFSSVFPEDAGTYTCQSDEGKSYSVQLNPFPTDSERKVTVYGPDKVNEIPEPLPDEFLTPTAPADRPPTAPDNGLNPDGSPSEPSVYPDGSPRQPGLYPDGSPRQPDLYPDGTSRLPDVNPDGTPRLPDVNPDGTPRLPDVNPDGTPRLPDVNPDGTPRQPDMNHDGTPRLPDINPDGTPRLPDVNPDGTPRQPDMFPDGIPRLPDVNPDGTPRQPDLYPDGTPRLPEVNPDGTPRQPDMYPDGSPRLPDVNPDGTPRQPDMYPDGMPRLPDVNPDGTPRQPDMFPDGIPRLPDVNPDGTPRQPDMFPDGIPRLPDVNPDGTPRQPDLYPDGTPRLPEVNPDGTPRQPDMYPDGMPRLPDVNPDGTPRQPDLYPDGTPRLPDINPDGTPRQPDMYPDGMPRLPDVNPDGTPRLPDVNPDGTPRQPDLYPDGTPKLPDGTPRQPDLYPDGTPRRPDVNPDGTPWQPDLYPDGAPRRPDFNPDGTPLQPDLYPDGTPRLPDVNPDGTPRQPDLFPDGTPRLPDGTPRQPDMYPDGTPRRPDVNPDGTPRQPDLYPDGTPRQPNLYPDGTPRQPDLYPDGTPRLPDGTPRQPDLYPDGTPRLPDGTPRQSDLYPDGTPRLLDVDPDGTPRLPDVNPDGTPRLPSVNPDGTQRAPIVNPDGTPRLPTVNPDGTPRLPSVNPDGTPRIPGVLPDGSPRQPGFPPYTFPRSSPSDLPLPLPPPVPQSMGGKKPQAIDPFPSPRIDMLSPERSPVTVTAKEGEPYVLECDTPWRPNDQISWYKNEVPLQLNRPGAPTQMENNLVFRTIRPTDRGKYTCTVNNNLQTATTILLDTVPADPSVIGNQDPEQLETREGNAYTLTCKLPNIRAEDTISWYKNGDPVRSSDNKIVRGAIEFKPVRLADRGSYYCVKNNDLGSTYAADLNVLPRDLTEKEPKAFVFTPVRPSVPLTPGTGQPIGTPVVPTPVDDFDSFRMPPPPPPIVGGLGPQPRPGPGPIPQVQRPAVPTSPITQVDPRDVEISPGHFRPVERTRFILECAISRTTGKVIWMKDGKSLSSEQPRDMNGNLIFGTVRMSDGGQYTCISDDRSQTYNAAVDVLPDDINTFLLSEKNKKPELRVPMLNYHRPMTETPFQLECDIPGADYQYPIVWFKDGQRINLSNPSPRAPQPRDNGRVLVFRSMLLSHSGVYSCQVGPEERTDIVDVRPESVQEYLLLSGKDDNTPNALLPEGEQLPSLTLPNSENSPKIKMAERGTMAVIKCETGYNLDPNAPIFWFKNKDLIAPSQRVQLRNDELLLSNVMPSDAALYTCVVGDGEATSSTRLFVTEPSDTSGPMVPEDPRIPQGPGIPPIVDTRPVDPSSVEISPGHFRPVERTRFNLECAISRTTGKVIWMKDGKSLGNELPQDMNGNLIFGSVRMSDGGQYTCISDDRSQTYNAAVDVLPDDINTFLLSEKNKKPELRVPMLNYHRPMTETPFQLECEIPGADYQYPIEWFKDGQRINLSNPSPRAPQPRDNGRVLVFRSMLLPHSGVYSCRVGPDERTDIVDVRPESVQEYLLLSGKDDNTPNALLPEGEQLPSLTLPNSENSPKIKMAERGTMAVIKCDSGFNTNANAPVSWFKNTELIALSPRVQIRNDELLIEDVLPSDAALYTCVLGDGEATSSTRLFVTEPSDQTGPMIPKVPRRPPSIDPRIPSTPGSPGSPPLPGSRLPPPPLPPPYLGDRDREFPDQGPAGPEPISPNDPQISPGHFRPIETTSFLLECKVPRNGGMVYWLKDGKVIPNPPVTRNMDLVMSPVQRRDSGVYTCVSEDRRTVYEAAVDVIPTNVYEFVQSERNKNPEDRRANIDYYRPKSNSVFNLNCDIPGADLRQPVIWTKDGGPLDASKPDLLIVRNSGRTLGFPSILRNQAGVYSCRIGNNERVSIVDVRPEKVQEYLLLSETDDESPTILLPNRGQTPVLRLPEEDSPKLIVAPAGSDVLIKCNVALNADPNIPVYWYKNGQLISEPQTRQIPHLNYLSVTNTDAGLYTCVLGNGDATSSTRLYVTDSLPDVPIPSGPRDQTSPRDGPFGARDVRPQIDPTDRLPQIDPPERLPPVGPRDRLPPIDEPFGPTDIAPEIDPRDSLQPINPTDRLPIDPRERLPQIDPRISLPQVDPEGSLRPFDSRDNLPPVEPREGFPQIDPGGRLPPVDPRGRLPNPGDRPVSPSGVMPPIPLLPIPRDPFDRNQETPISPYPKGSEPGFTDTQEGRYPLPNLEIPGQINDPLLTEGPDTPSEPGLDARTVLSQVNPEDRIDPLSRRPPVLPDTRNIPPVPTDRTGPIDPRGTLPTGFPTGPGTGGRFVVPSLGGIIEQFFYPRISQDFTLPCNIKGITANTPIVWYKGDQRFIPDSRRVRIVNNAIVFRPAIAEDSGSYSCMRPDTLESIRAQLYVYGDALPPGVRDDRFSQVTPTERTGSLVQHFYYPSSSELFELRCDLKSGDNRVPIRWLKNGQPFIVPVDRPVSLHENNHVIRFSSISPRDNGRYTCIAGDNLASVSSEIVVKRPDIGNTPWEKRISLSSNDRDALLRFTGTQGFSNKYFPIVKKPFILNCTAAEDTPMLPVRWLRNGQPFLPDGQRVFPRSSSLVFSSILPDDSGHYTCIVGDNQKAENVIVDVIFHDMSAEENTPARPILRRRYLLTCGITSLRPNTQITWFKDGQPFNANNDRVRFIDNKRGVLFTSLLEQDNGEYMCIANYGSSRASYTTTVNAAEEKLHEIITVPLAPTEHRAPIAERFTLECVLSSVSETFPPIWMKDGRPFDRRSAPPNVSFRDRSIVFDPLTPSDEGRYTCASQDGSDRYTSELIPVPRVFNPTEGRPLSVRCLLPGRGPVTWTKNGQPFPSVNSRTTTFSDNGRTITFTPVSPRNDGEYQCISANGQRYPLMIKVIPTMLFPQSKSIFVLQCALRDMNSRKMIVWLKDGQVFRPRQDRVSFNVGDGVREVIFDPLLPEDSGRYACVDPDKNQYMVNVIVDGRTAARRNLQPTVTQAFRISCDIPGISPSTTVFWLKGQELYTPPRESIKFEDGNKDILFESVMPEDYGSYTCVTADGSEHYTINLDVQSGPGHKHVKVGVTEREVSKPPAKSTFIMKCDIPGLEPGEQVVWLKDQQVFNPMGDRVRLGPLGRIATFLPVEPEDSGLYTCVSELSGTTLSQIVEVGPPLYPGDYTMEVSPDFYRPVETKPFSLYCNIPNYNGRVFWLKNGRILRVPPASSISLHDNDRRIDFDAVMPGDSGFYMCVTDDFSTFYPAAVDVLPFPIYQYLSTLRPGDRLPANLDYLRVPAGTRQELVCRISNPRAPIVWEKDGQVLQQIGRGSISAPVFNSITKADSGVYRCVSDDQTYTVLVDVVPQPVQEYLLLSDRPDNKPSLRLPNRMPDKPRLSLPGSPEEKLRYAAPGEQYSLVCDVPDTRSRIYWFKDGVPYASPRPNVMVDNDQGLIRFGALTDADNGVYTCVTANGESTYSTRLSINPRHRKVTVNLAERVTSQAFALGRFQLFCNIPTLDPLDEVAWYKDNQLFLPAVGRDITFSAEGRSITFGRIRETDAGVYTCISQRTGDEVSQEVIVSQPIYPDYYKVEVSPGYFRPVESKPFTLQCPGTGSSVLWIKDGRPLDDRQGRLSFSNGNRQVIFRNILREDSGNYACISQDGRILHLSAVDVVPQDVYNYIMALGPPDRQNNQNLNLPSNLGYFRPRSGDMFELYCNLSASALRQPITWTKDDNVLPRARNQRVLVFPSITEEDGGHYSCKAGNSEYNALVDVKPRSVQEYLLLSDTTDEKPTLLLPDAMDERPMLELPLDVREDAKIQTRPPGVGYILVCDLPPTVEYNAPIRWYKNGAAYDIPNTGRVSLLENGRVLQFATLKKEDAGLYSCIAGDNLALFASKIIIAPGAAGAGAAQEVDALALANRQQHNIRINQQFTLECGIPRTLQEVPIIWLKNGAPFVSPDRNRVQVNPRSIVFSPVQTVDTGRYTCMAIDNSASFTSALNVMAAGARVGDTQLLNIWQQQFRPRVLGAFELTCALPNFVDPSTPVVWMKNGRRMPLDTSGRITYRNGNRKMIFSEITPDDRGWYTCVALDNSASYTLSLAVDLDGYTDSDSIGTALRISNAQLGMVFDLRCLLTDTGKPITWTKNGEPLQNDPTNRRTFRNGLWTIRFNPLRSSDAGYYTCRYADGSMSYSTAIRVIGGSGSDFRSIRNFYLMQLGGKFELRCGIQSRDPNFEVIWLKDGQVFNPRRSRGVSFANGNSRIVFNSLLPEDAGFYTCISGGRRYFSRLYMSNPIQQESIGCVSQCGTTASSCSLQLNCTNYLMCEVDGKDCNCRAMMCPFGTFWNPESQRCTSARTTPCDSDPCRMLPARSTYPSDYNCRSFYRCSNTGNSVPMCCNALFKYDHRTMSCQPDSRCNIGCRERQIIVSEPSIRLITVRPQGGECFLRAVPGKPNTYYNVASGSTHSCPSGTVFNERDCVCENSFTLTHIQKQTSALVKECHMLLQMVFGRGYVRNISPHGVYTDIIDVDISDSGNLKTPVGVFNGKTSSISTPRFINDEIEAIYVTFNFLEKDGGDYQVLFSNCGALTVPYTVPGVPGKRTSSVEILLDKRRQEIIFIGKTDDVAINSVISRVPYSANQWNKVELTFDGYKLKGVVTSDINGTPVREVIVEPLMGRLIPSPIVTSLGRCSDNNAFRGYMDKIKVSNCIPLGLSLLQ